MTHVLLEEVERFRWLVGEHLGLAFDDGKLGMLQHVLGECCARRGVAPTTFLSRAMENPQRELVPFAAMLTVGETYFFRNRDQLVAFAGVVVPERRRTSKPMRILSAGCATGEEPYTIAMILREAGLDQADATIRAVDVNPEALERAARGKYSTWSLRETPAPVQRAWFRPEGRDQVLAAEIREAVQFGQRNLVLDDADLWAPSTYDVIFCRNVIMYFTPPIMKQVIANLARALRPGGYLFLGHAETLRGLSNELDLCHTHGTFYYQRREGAPAALGAPVVLATPVAHEPAGWIEAVERASARISALAIEPTLERSVEPQPWDLGAALELLRDERFGDALAAIERHPGAGARVPHVLLLRAVLLAHTAQFTAATEVAHGLLGIRELAAGAHYVLALCREAMADHGGATEHDQLALTLDPTFAMARLHLGVLARRSGDHARARRELARAAVLFEREDAERLVLFGGGFQREALISLCRSEHVHEGRR